MIIDNLTLCHHQRHLKSLQSRRQKHLERIINTHSSIWCTKISNNMHINVQLKKCAKWHQSSSSAAVCRQTQGMHDWTWLDQSNKCIDSNAITIQNNIINIYFTRALSERKPPPIPTFQEKMIWDSKWIAGIIWIRMTAESVPKFCVCLILSVSVILPSMPQIGRRLHEKCWQMSENPYSTTVQKIKKWSGIHTWIRITTKS